MYEGDSFFTLGLAEAAGVLGWVPVVGAARRFRWL